jgi:hypothetical protein
MCGIVAYGNRTARGILLEGLKRLEYRGSDLAGFHFRVLHPNSCGLLSSIPCISLAFTHCPKLRQPGVLLR